MRSELFASIQKVLIKDESLKNGWRRCRMNIIRHPVTI
jgi:hypothetical protein